MSSEKRFPLPYTHDEIINLLRSVSTGKVLTEKEYKTLTSEIGLDNIFTLDEYREFSQIAYDRIIANVEEYVEEQMRILKEDIIEQTEADDDKTRQSLEEHLRNYDELLEEIRTGSIKLNEDAKVYIDNVVDTMDSNILDISSELDEKINTKADIEHTHQLEEVNDLLEVLEYKADRLHIHENDHSHHNKYLLDSLNELTFKKWDAKVDRSELDKLPENFLELMSVKGYINDENIEEHLKHHLPDFSRYLLAEDLDYHLVEKADRSHKHLISHVDNLEDSLHLKVDKERGKTLIREDILKKITDFVNSPILPSLNHVHSNVDVLEHIDFLRLEMWDKKIDSHDLECKLQNYTTTEIIENYYNKDETYSKEEIANLIAEGGFSTLDEVNALLETLRTETLGGVRIETISKEEFDKLTDEQQRDPSVLYLVDDENISDETFMTANMFDDRFHELIEQSDKVISETKLDDRLGGMSFKRMTTKEYKDGVEKGEIDPKDTSIMYILIDSIENNTEEFITREEFENKTNNMTMPNNRPENPQIGQCFFDPEIKLPLWFDGENWIDATGNIK